MYQNLGILFQDLEFCFNILSFLFQDLEKFAQNLEILFQNLEIYFDDQFQKLAISVKIVGNKGVFLVLIRWRGVARSLPAIVCGRGEVWCRAS